MNISNTIKLVKNGYRSGVRGTQEVRQPHRYLEDIYSKGSEIFWRCLIIKKKAMEYVLIIIRI